MESSKIAKTSSQEGASSTMAKRTKKKSEL